MQSRLRHEIIRVKPGLQHSEVEQVPVYVQIQGTFRMPSGSLSAALNSMPSSSIENLRLVQTVTAHCSALKRGVVRSAATS